MKGKTILVISPEKWGQNFVSKHHYAKCLAKDNMVYFLNPADGYSLNPFYKTAILTTSISQNLTTVDFKNKIPRLNSCSKKIQERIYRNMAQEIQKAIGVKQFDIVWSFDPYRFFDQAIWNALKKIYQSMDIHYNAKFENEIVRTSDLVLVCSDGLNKFLPKNKLGINIGHGVDTDPGNNYTIPLPGNNEIKAAIIGNFNNYIDYPLLEKIALQHTKLDLICIGPTDQNNLGNTNNLVKEQIKKLKTHSNIHFIGSIDAKEINSILSQTQLNLVLYNEATKVLNSHKILSYILSGNITISSYIDDYSDFDSDLIIVVKKNSEILTQISEVIKNLDKYNHPSLKAKRVAYASDKSYDSIISKIKDLLY